MSAVGEQVVLMGRSGCGKTTLLHIIAGVGRPDQGSVVIDGYRYHPAFRGRNAIGSGP